MKSRVFSFDDCHSFAEARWGLGLGVIIIVTGQEHCQNFFNAILFLWDIA